MQAFHVRTLRGRSSRIDYSWSLLPEKSTNLQTASVPSKSRYLARTVQNIIAVGNPVSHLSHYHSVSTQKNKSEHLDTRTDRIHNNQKLGHHHVDNNENKRSHDHKNDHDHSHNHEHKSESTQGHQAHRHDHHNELQAKPLTPGPHKLVVSHANFRNPPLKQGVGIRKTLFIDAYTSGMAGDMFVAALLDLGLPMETLIQGLEGLGLSGFSCEVIVAERSAIVAPRFVVKEDFRQPFRDYSVIKELLANANLPPGARAIALKAFRLLAEAEASVHGVDVESVHFHEVGAVDSIVDIVAASIGFDFIGASNVVVSPLPMGRGVIQGAAHGPLPCPAPATLEIICRCRLATYDSASSGELVTPTGACIAGAVAASVNHWPSIRPIRSSYGAGTKVLADRPNLLRLVLGDTL